MQLSSVVQAEQILPRRKVRTNIYARWKFLTGDRVIAPNNKVRAAVISCRTKHAKNRLAWPGMRSGDVPAAHRRSGLLILIEHRLLQRTRREIDSNSPGFSANNRDVSSWLWAS